jgi:hypothetical protein
MVCEASARVKPACGQINVPIHVAEVGFGSFPVAEMMVLAPSTPATEVLRMAGKFPIRLH